MGCGETMTEIERCTKRDFDGILAEFERFWDDDATLPRHHVMFVREFGDSAWQQKNVALARQLMTQHIPADGESDVVSVIAGYTFEPESEVEISIGNRQFQMFTLDDTAWNYAEDDDRQMVQAMISGTTMVAVGTSNRGTVTTDTYSLLGFTAARSQMGETCN